LAWRCSTHGAPRYSRRERGKALYIATTPLEPVEREAYYVKELKYFSVSKL
jgi:hypothetical protein